MASEAASSCIQLYKCKECERQFLGHRHRNVRTPGCLTVARISHFLSTLEKSRKNHPTFCPGDLNMYLFQGLQERYDVIVFRVILRNFISDNLL